MLELAPQLIDRELVPYFDGVRKKGTFPDQMPDVDTRIDGKRKPRVLIPHSDGSFFQLPVPVPLRPILSFSKFIPNRCPTPKPVKSNSPFPGPLMRQYNSHLRQQP